MLPECGYTMIMSGSMTTGRREGGWAGKQAGGQAGVALGQELRAYISMS